MTNATRPGFKLFSGVCICTVNGNRERSPIDGADDVVTYDGKYKRMMIECSKIKPHKGNAGYMQIQHDQNKRHDD